MVCTMESLDGQQNRQRKMKFEPIELEVLVEEANKHLDELQQKKSEYDKKEQMKLREDGKI